MAKNLGSYVSGKIARSNPLEGGREFDAAADGSGVKANTWGGYATELMDLYDLEPQEAIDLLGLTPEQMRDPHVHFQRGNWFYAFKNSMINKYEEDARKDLLVEARRLIDVVDIVMNGYRLPDIAEANARAEEIQDDMDDESRRIRELARRETEEERQEQDIRCMDRDAHYSGVRISVDEFVAVMLSTNVLSEEHPSELAQIWISALSDAVEYFWIENARPDFEIGKMIAGRDIFETFKSNLKDVHRLSYEYAQARWKVVEPVFIADARSLRELALVTGQEEK